jgi:hypothetical protein
MNMKKADLEPYELPRPHNGVRKINPLLYAFYNPDTVDNDARVALTITAAELANCIEYGAAVRKGKPTMAPLAYDQVSTWFNNPVWKDKRRFPQFIDGEPTTTGTPPQFHDFGIQKEHRGDTIKRDSIENNPFKRGYVFDAMFQVAKMKEDQERAQAGSNKRPHAQSVRRTAGSSNNRGDDDDGRPAHKKRRHGNKDTGSRAKATGSNDAEEDVMDEDKSGEKDGETVTA